MNMDAWIDAIRLKEELIAAGAQNRPGVPMTPTRITIHNTDNTDKGADAHAHSQFVRKTGYYVYKGKKRWVSWHYTVDDRVAIRQLPDRECGLHAGTATGNASSIGIEICMQQGIDQVAANRRAAQLAAYLLVQHGMQRGAVVRHQHWSGKDCPSLLLGEAAWRSFLELVSTCVESLQSSGDKSNELPGEDFVFNGMCWGDDDA